MIYASKYSILGAPYTLYLGLLLAIFSIQPLYLFAQIDSIQNLQPHILPNTLGTHPFGIYISRISHNFYKKPSKKPAITAHYSNGNVWSPEVRAYVPSSEEYVKELKNFEWHDRERVYYKSSPAKTYQLHADAIYRVYQLKFELPIARNQDLKLNIRGYSVDGGYPPYSLITSDEFIEWLHTNVIKDEDPFDRKLYGYNKTDVRYTDLNGDSFKLSAGDGGIN